MRRRERHRGQRCRAPERACLAQMPVHEAAKQGLLGHPALREHPEREPGGVRAQLELGASERGEEGQANQQGQRQCEGGEQCPRCRRAEAERASAYPQVRPREHVLGREREHEDCRADDEAGFATRAAEGRGEPVERNEQQDEYERVSQSVSSVFAIGSAV